MLFVRYDDDEDAVDCTYTYIMRPLNVWSRRLSSVDFIILVGIALIQPTNHNNVDREVDDDDAEADRINHCIVTVS